MSILGPFHRDCSCSKGLSLTEANYVTNLRRDVTIKTSDPSRFGSIQVSGDAPTLPWVRPRVLGWVMVRVSSKGGKTWIDPKFLWEWATLRKLFLYRVVVSAKNADSIDRLSDWSPDKPTSWPKTNIISGSDHSFPVGPEKMYAWLLGLYMKQDDT